jgi:Flp pilus assembly protein TadG
VGTGQNREREFFERAAALIMGNNRRERKLHTASRAIGQWSGNEGSSLVEFAVSVPVLLTFFFGLIQVSIASYTRAAISECAREGTRYAMVHGSTCETASGASCTLTAPAIESYVSSIPWPNLGGGGMTVIANYPDINESPGSRVQVTVTYVFPLNVPFTPKSSFTMSSTSLMYIVQ